ncbi:MAG TPA: hypothetical protein VK750_01575 [Cytophagaceae bacterium]|nr:hypothetical protein [Cytophagaceae bacterium]
MALQDSTISSQDFIISVMGKRIASRDTLLSQKDSTIKNISNLVPKAIDGEKFWHPFKKGVGAGVVITVIGIAVVKVIFSNKY